MSTGRVIQENESKVRLTGKANVILFKHHRVPPYVLEQNDKFDNLRLALIGSCGELGGWDFNRRINASKSFKKDVWEASALIPVFSEFEWAWIVVGVARDDPRRFRDDVKKEEMEQLVEWEKTTYDYRRSRVTDLNGVIHTVWGNSKQFFNSKSCRVTVRTEYVCNSNETIALTGSGSSLGDWDPQKAVFARHDPSNPESWTAKLIIQPDVMYSWKWIVVERKTRQCKRWEEREDRFLYTRYDGLDVFAPWNGDAVENATSISMNSGLPEDLILKYLDGDRSLLSNSTLSWLKQGLSNIDNGIHLAFLPCNYVTVIEKRTDKSTMTGNDNVTQTDKIFVAKPGSIFGGPATILTHPFGFLSSRKSVI